MTTTRRRWWLELLGLSTAAAVLVLAGCSGDTSQDGPGPLGPVGPVGQQGESSGIPGSEDVVEISVDVADFDAIDFRSEGSVRITIGNRHTVTIEADDNLQPYFEIQVIEETLIISTTAGVDIAPSQPAVFSIETSTLTAVNLAGAGAIAIDAITSDSLAVGLEGVGDITIGSIVVDALTANLSGVGSISIAGAAQRQDLLVSGVTAYDGANLESQEAVVEAKGAGQATVWVRDHLDVTATDSASVQYYGTPALDQNVSNGASVTPLGAK